MCDELKCEIRNENTGFQYLCLIVDNLYIYGWLLICINYCIINMCSKKISYQSFMNDSVT